MYRLGNISFFTFVRRPFFTISSIHHSPRKYPLNNWKSPTILTKHLKKELKHRPQSFYNLKDFDTDLDEVPIDQADETLRMESERIDPTTSYIPSCLSIKEIITFLEFESNIPAKLFKLNSSSYGLLNTDSVILLQIDINRARHAIAEALIRNFKQFFPHNKIARDGMDASDNDWIVIDLNVAIVHIISSSALDAYKLECLWTENAEKLETSNIQESLSRSYGRKDCKDPSRTKHLDLLFNRSLGTSS